VNHRACTLAVVAILLSLPAAGAIKLDDSLSPQQRVLLTPKPEFEDTDNLSDEQLNAWVARINGLEIRLDTRAYVGQQADIYLSLPVFISGIRGPTGLRLEWQTRGQFAAGSTIPGQRVLLFQGIISEPVMTELFNFTVHIDGRYYEGNLQFDPVFEIEPLTP
jgi:hypothetical protein